MALGRLREPLEADKDEERGDGSYNTDPSSYSLDNRINQAPNGCARCARVHSMDDLLFI